MIGERLLEREGERDALVAALESARSGRGRLVVLEGDAGRGKTALLGVAAELAAARGARVLSAHGGVLERDVGWGVVRQLFEPLVLGPERVEGLLDGAARAAGPVFGLASADATAPLGGDAAPSAVHALFHVVARLAEAGPLLVAVDDAHWADAASLRWLVYLGRRVERLPVVVAVARRLGEPSDGDALLDELHAVRGAVVVEPPALSGAAAGMLATEAFGTAADPGFTGACVEATGGNPFLLVELLRALAADGAPPSAQTAEKVRALRPPTVVADVQRRLGRLSPEAVALAEALAVLDGEAELRHVVAQAGQTPAAGEAAADELTLARLVGPGRPLRFTHPLLRAAVEAELPPARRAAAHRRAAELLDAEPALADRAATHLLVCEPAADAWVARRLRAAAQRAIARGAPETAVRLLERALREPDEDWEVRSALGGAHRLAGRLEPAAAQLALALERCPPGPERAQIAPELATALALTGRSEEGVAVLERERAALPSGTPERRRLESSSLGLRMLVDALVVDAAERVEREAAAVDGVAPTDGMLLGALALTRARTASRGATGAADTAQRALAGDRVLLKQSPNALMFVFVAGVLTLADRDRDTDRWLDVLEDEAAEHGAELTRALAAMGRARVRLFRGELGAAVACAREGLEGALVGSSYMLLTTAGTLTEVLVERGDLDEAERLLGDLELDGAALPGVGGALTLVRGRMRMRAAQGQHAAAAVDADDVLARLERREHRAPGPLGEVALVLHRAGAAERARSLAEVELERARHWGTASALGVGRRVLGTVAGGVAGRRLLEAAVADLQATPCRLERAKALLALGAALRRANQRAAARDWLRPALDLAARCEAAPLVERAEAELRACGARPRRALLSGPDALTASERRVAELAARGLSNPEVARELVISRATVESHLRAVYRKLDIASRDQLGAALGERAPTP